MTAPRNAPHHEGAGGERPPRFAEWLAARVLPREARDETLGDLHERYVARLQRSGRARAARWYCRQVLGFVTRVPAARARAAASGVSRRPTGWATDLRHAGRAVLRERGLTAAVILVLGLAVGAATTVFAVVSAVLLRPLPVADPDALVMLWDEYPAESGAVDPLPVTLEHYEAWRQLDLFSASGVFESIPAVIDAGQWPERVDAALVSASLLPVLGVQPARGRLFTDDDDQPGAPPVAILSHELWYSRFGGDEDLIGRSIPIDGEPTRIVGILPPDFWFYDPYAAVRSYRGTGASSARLWRPLAGRFADEHSRDYPRYRMIARLRPGVSRDAALAAVADAERRLPLEPSSADGRVRVLALEEQIAGAVRPRLLGIAAAVGLVVLVAGINLVSLLTARFHARRPELAVRAALGAGRARLVRTLMLHAGLLALAGGAAGVLAAAAATPPLLELVPRGLPLSHRVGMDALVFAFAAFLSLAIGVLVCLLAASRLGLARMTAGLAGSRWAVGRFHGHLTDTLIAVQAGLSLVLLIAAALLLRSFVATDRTDAGFDRRDALTFQSLLMLSAAEAATDFSFHDRLEARIASLPGVVSVGSSTVLPFTRWGGTAAVRVGAGESAVEQRVSYRAVSPGYFDALRIDRLAGRPFSAADGAAAPPVAIVNRAFVDEYLRGAEPGLGQRVLVRRGGRSTGRVIVGVVANVKEYELVEPDRPTVYVPASQTPTPMRQFVVRVKGSPEAFVEPIRRAALALDRAQPLSDFITLDALVAQSLEEERFYAVLAGAFASIAVLLALAGLYGVVSFAVRQRDREMGVRLALGAGRRAVYRLILWSGMRPVLIGVIAGCVGGAGAARLLRGIIHGVGPGDPLVYAAVAAAFAIVAAAACLIPARRAASIDPVQTLSQG